MYILFAVLAALLSTLNWMLGYPAVSMICAFSALLFIWCHVHDNP